METLYEQDDAPAYLKQWKNRNQLAGGAAEIVEEDGEGGTVKKKRMRTRTLDELAEDLMNMDRLKKEERSMKK